MSTKDIHGCQANTKGLGIFHNVKRRTDQVRTFGCGDIERAVANSFKKGPTTMRATDSLFREYTLPGHSELENVISPYSLSKRERDLIEKQK